MKKTTLEIIKEMVREKISEEAPANAVGGGNIAGLGVGPQGEPGVPMSARERHKKRVEDSSKEQEETNPVMAMLRRKAQV